MATSPVFLPGESHGQRSLLREWLPTPVFWHGEFQRLCSPWGHKESDTTERLSHSLQRDAEDLTPGPVDMTLFGDRAFEEVFKIK